MFFAKWYEIYNRNNRTLLKYTFQGGIVGAKGFTGIFMVHSVLAIPSTGYVKRELSGSPYEQPDRKQQTSSFSQILDEKLEEQKTASMNCQTTTYGNDRRIHTFQYLAREYHY